MDIFSDVKNPDPDKVSNFSGKKLLYFSDGTLEVDVTDDVLSEDIDLKTVSQVNQVNQVNPVNPQQLTWLPWMWYQTTTAGSKALEVCDYLGESLASFFGITTPKYQYEINEYLRMKKEEEEEAKNDIEMGSWANTYNSDHSGGAISTSPKTLNIIQ